MNSTSRKTSALLPYGLTAVSFLAAGQAHGQSFLDQDWDIPVLPEQLYEETVAGGPTDGIVTLTLDGEARTSYQTNIYGGPSSTAVSSLVFEASPRANLRINTGRIEGRIQVGADYTRYLANSANDQLDLFVRANMNFNVNDQLTIRTAAAVVQNEVGISNNTTVPNLTPIETRTETRTTAEIGADYDGQAFDVSATLGVDVFRNNGLQQTNFPLAPIDNSLRDRTRLYANLEATNQLSNGNEMFGGFSGALIRYENEGTDEKRDSIEISPYLGIRTESADGTLVAEGSTGFIYRDFESTQYDAVFTPSLDANVRWRPVGSGGEITASTSTTLEDATSSGVGATIVQDFEVAATFEPVEQLKLTGGLAGAYSLSNTSDAFGGGRDSDFTIRPSVDAQYFLSDTFYVGANAYYEQEFGGSSSESDLGIGLSAGLSY